jgi:hypothetical protein
MMEMLLAALILIALMAFGIGFCRSYEDAKDAGYIQTDYEEARDDGAEG